MKNLSFLKRLNFAIRGIAVAFKTESSLRLQFLAIPCLVGILILFKASAVWCGIFSFSAAGILAAEMFNTALEKLIDHLHPEQHNSIKVVKDCAAGAVLILSLNAILVFIFFLFAKFAI
jgi:diacylglycerol kinase (ATP)